MRIIDWSSNVCSSDLWWPFAWLSNRLDIDRLVIPRATLHKLPRLNPSEREGPILPGFDIRLMQFSVGRLTIDRRVTGKIQQATLSGDADIRGGRAIIHLSARELNSSEERRVGKECVSPCRYRWSQCHEKKKNKKTK